MLYENIIPGSLTAMINRMVDMYQKAETKHSYTLIIVMVGSTDFQALKIM